MAKPKYIPLTPEQRLDILDAYEARGISGACGTLKRMLPDESLRRIKDTVDELWRMHLRGKNVNAKS
jgi:hypothetical protein